ncbi:MAG: GNAT family N-acetyltransferase [Oceanospirillaceae bacterium]|nr:GNAT family N-acetyltransferase [Oceanospirillaceae bacterium]
MSINPPLKSIRFDLIPIKNQSIHNDHLIEMMQDSEIQRYINGNPLSDTEALQGLDRFHKISNKNGLGFWLIYNNEQQCVGMCLLKPLPTGDEIELIETGYWIKPAYWGQRIASEVTLRLLRYAFDDLDLELVTAVVEPENIASRKTLERSGLTNRGSMRAYDKELPFYTISKDEFNHRCQTCIDTVST